MYNSYPVVFIIWAVIFMSTISNESFGQLETSTSVNITETLLDIYPFVSVEYETDSMIVLKGDEDSLLIINGTLAPFWEAVDEVKKEGYTLDEVTTSGMGSQGNPTRFYAILVR